MKDTQICMLIKFVQLIQLFSFHPDIWYWQGLHITKQLIQPTQ